jgi:hypothetical protein
MERFAFDQQIVRMAEKNLLYEVIKAFSKVDLSPDRVDNMQMGVCLRGVNPSRGGASKRRGRRALHTARGHSADGEPPALTRKRPTSLRLNDAFTGAA